jgi:hypothetical protein
MDDCYFSILLKCDYITCNHFSYTSKHYYSIVSKIWYHKYIHDQLPYKKNKEWIYKYDKLPFQENWQYKYIHMIVTLDVLNDSLEKLDRLKKIDKIIKITPQVIDYIPKYIIKKNFFATNITILLDVDKNYYVMYNNMGYRLIKYEEMKLLLFNLIYYDS